jgi:hypothetical protein
MLAIARRHLQRLESYGPGGCREIPANVFAAEMIECALNELEGALALIPGLDAIVLSNDLPYIRRFYKGPPFESDGTSG